VAIVAVQGTVSWLQRPPAAAVLPPVRQAVPPGPVIATSAS